MIKKKIFSNKILNAKVFAMNKHAGQKDDDGENYFYSHILPMVHAIENFTYDEDVICATYLHDVLEDTDTTYEELKEEFGKRVADLVYEVTHEGKKDSYGFYFPRLKSKDAILIKFIDRASNISRMDSWNEGRKAQYLRKSKFWKEKREE